MQEPKGGSEEIAGSGNAVRPGEARGPLWKKWAWFAGLWAAGVLVVGSLGYLLRWWLHP